ncbi:cytochrome P450 4C1-like isoform X2 [Rhodnius prolixus]
MNKIDICMDDIMGTTLRPTRWIKCIFDRTQEGIAVKKHSYDIRGPLREIIQWHKKMGTIVSEQEENKSYVDILVKVGKYFNMDLDGLSHLGTDFIIAGTDTTSVILSGCLFCLASYPEYQEEVYKEQVEIMGNSLDAPSKSQLAEMHYLDRVINEALRIWAPIGIHRLAEEDIKLDDKYTIPKGTAIDISLYMMNRNSKYYEKPFDFYPDHFLPDKIAARPKSSFCVFSTGVRGCPGKYYGLLSMKMTVSRVIRRFRLSTKTHFLNLEYVHKLMLEPLDGFIIELEKRKS